MAWKQWDKTKRKLLTQLAVDYANSRQRSVIFGEVVHFIHKTQAEKGINESLQDIAEFLKYVQESKKPKRSENQIGRKNTNGKPGSVQQEKNTSPLSLPKTQSPLPRSHIANEEEKIIQRKLDQPAEIKVLNKIETTAQSNSSSLTVVPNVGSTDCEKQLNGSICMEENHTSSPAEVKENKKASTAPRNTSVAGKRRKSNVTVVSCSQGSENQICHKNTNGKPGSVQQEKNTSPLSLPKTQSPLPRSHIANEEEKIIQRKLDQPAEIKVLNKIETTAQSNSSSLTVVPNVGSTDCEKQLNGSICMVENHTSSPAEVKENKKASTAPRNTSVAGKRRKSNVTVVSCSQDGKIVSKSASLEKIVERLVESKCDNSKENHIQSSTLESHPESFEKKVHQEECKKTLKNKTSSNERKLKLSVSKRQNKSGNSDNTIKGPDRNKKSNISASNINTSEICTKTRHIEASDIPKTDSPTCQQVDKSPGINQTRDPQPGPSGLNDVSSLENHSTGQLCHCNKNPCNCDGFMPTSPVYPSGSRRSQSPLGICTAVKRRRSSTQSGVNDVSSLENHTTGQLCHCNKNPCNCDGFMPTSPVYPSGSRRSQSPLGICTAVKRRRSSTQSGVNDVSSLENHATGQLCHCNKNPCNCDGFMPTSPVYPSGSRRSQSPLGICTAVKRRRSSTKDQGSGNAAKSKTCNKERKNIDIERKTADCHDQTKKITVKPSNTVLLQDKKKQDEDTQTEYDKEKQIVKPIPSEISDSIRRSNTNDLSTPQGTEKPTIVLAPIILFAPESATKTEEIIETSCKKTALKMTTDELNEIVIDKPSKRQKKTKSGISGSKDPIVMRRSSRSGSNSNTAVSDNKMFEKLKNGDGIDESNKNKNSKILVHVDIHVPAEIDGSGEPPKSPHDENIDNGNGINGKLITASSLKTSPKFESQKPMETRRSKKLSTPSKENVVANNEATCDNKNSKNCKSQDTDSLTMSTQSIAQNPIQNRKTRQCSAQTTENVAVIHEAISTSPSAVTPTKKGRNIVKAQLTSQAMTQNVSNSVELKIKEEQVTKSELKYKTKVKKVPGVELKIKEEQVSKSELKYNTIGEKKPEANSIRKAYLRDRKRKYNQKKRYELMLQNLPQRVVPRARPPFWQSCPTQQVRLRPRYPPNLPPVTSISHPDWQQWKMYNHYNPSPSKNFWRSQFTPSPQNKNLIYVKPLEKLDVKAEETPNVEDTPQTSNPDEPGTLNEEYGTQNSQSQISKAPHNKGLFSNPYTKVYLHRKHRYMRDYYASGKVEEAKTELEDLDMAVPFKKIKLSLPPHQSLPPCSIGDVQTIFDAVTSDNIANPPVDQPLPLSNVPADQDAVTSDNIANPPVDQPLPLSNVPADQDAVTSDNIANPPVDQPLPLSNVPADQAVDVHNACAINTIENQSGTSSHFPDIKGSSGFLNTSPPLSPSMVFPETPRKTKETPEAAQGVKKSEINEELLLKIIEEVSERVTAKVCERFENQLQKTIEDKVSDMLKTMKK